MGKFLLPRSWAALIGVSMIPLFLMSVGVVDGRVSVTTGENATYSFPDADAAFGGMIPPSGMRGVLSLAHPLDACGTLDRYEGEEDVFALIKRGNCNFDVKVQNAQDAGYAAAIVFNNEPNGELTTMAAASGGLGIDIPAVFVTNMAGQELMAISEQRGAICYVTSTFENTVWSVMAVSFISLLAVCAIMATFFFVRRHRLRRVGSRLILTGEHLGMTVREVRALPSFTFKSGDGGNGTTETCAICLEDYEPGDKLRLLPCRHEFHMACIDQWLTTRRAFCPVCKRDAHENTPEPPATETTPLLTTVPQLPREAHPVPAGDAAIEIPDDAGNTADTEVEAH
eukprot:TRINITY_DN23633_c0_g1_i1.p1 TRINITY_DN23633_c0_g1~~TRINITY_DN23633_c0_g1_i1.p1  ORF type:complete len:341 (-),score=30.79 TRINITY_DN23633_c0_g1_i1:853-1875(-)